MPRSRRNAAEEVEHAFIEAWGSIHVYFQLWIAVGSGQAESYLWQTHDTTPLHSSAEDTSKRKRRRAPLWLCLISPVWIVLAAYAYLSHTYGWTQVFFLWAPTWTMPLLTLTPWDIENGVLDPKAPGVFDWNGFKAKKLRDGVENADVTLIYDFVSEKEIATLQRYFERDLTIEYSGNTKLATDDELQEKIYSYIRTSHGGWVPQHDKVIAAVSKRVAMLLGIPAEYCEVPTSTNIRNTDFYMIQYKQGQQFRAHYDLYDIDPRFPLPREESLRGLSVLFYLSDVPENGGGETIFPLARPPLKVNPKKGSIIVWRNCIPFSEEEKRQLEAEGDLSCVPKKICCKERDWRSIHAGLPIQGPWMKFTMTRWVREASIECCGYDRHHDSRGVLHRMGVSDDRMSEGNIEHWEDFRQRKISEYRRKHKLPESNGSEEDGAEPLPRGDHAADWKWGATVTGELGDPEDFGAGA